MLLEAVLDIEETTVKLVTAFCFGALLPTHRGLAARPMIGEAVAMRRTALILAATGFAGGAVAQAPNWTQITTANSPTGSNCGLTYDSARGKVVSFGGFSGGWLSDTWEYDGVNWTQIGTVNNPSGRFMPAMVYDSIRGKVVLFGGASAASGQLNTLSDTWEYDGVNWTQVGTATSPGPVWMPAMVYDSIRGKVVMLAGSAPQANAATWEYDGVDWAQVATANSPTAFGEHGTVYDSVRGKVVVFGGRANTNTTTSDTWEYDGIDWVQVTTAHSPNARYRPAMAYHSTNGVAVMFGGWGGGFLNDTWEYDGGDWVRVTTANSPSGSNGPEAVFDSARGKVVMVGDQCTNMWEYTRLIVSSAALTYGTGCGATPLDFSPTSNPILGTTARAVIANAPTAYAGVTMGWSNSHLAGVPLLPLDLAFIGMPGCLLLHSKDVFGLPVSPLTASTLQFDLPIPFQSTLLWANVYLQAYCLAPGENALNIVASNGIRWVIGNQ